MSQPFLGSKFTANDYARARRKYRPDKIMILFVAESPPSSGGFFYFSKTIGKDHLFREMMKALGFWPMSRPMGGGIDKRPLLLKFRSRGFFLIDTCRSPVDKLSSKKRSNAVRQEAPSVASRVQHLNPAHVIIIKKTVFHPVLDALARDGLSHKVLNKEPLPFPSHGNQPRFRKDLTLLIGSQEPS